MTWGGKRKGAGRKKKWDEPTIRINRVIPRRWLKMLNKFLKELENK